MDRAGHIPLDHSPKEFAEYLCVHGSQDFQNLIIGQSLSQIKGNTLIQQTESISHRAISGLGNIPDCLLFCLYSLNIQKFFQSGCNSIYGNPVKIISLTPGQDRNRNLVRLCCCQNKDHIRGRLLQCFQQSVERSCGKHMNLINDVDFIFSLCGTVGYLLPDLTDIIHTIIGGSIDLYHIHGSSRLDCLAHGALVAGTSIHRMLTVHCLCQDLSYCGFTCTSGSAEQIGMTNTVMFNLVCQGSYYMILTLNIRKIIWSEFPVKGSITHEFTPVL